jgi:transposase
MMPRLLSILSKRAVAIPTSRDRKVQRSVDQRICRQRNLIERFFSKLKHFRRVATRYDKTARNFPAAVLLAATVYGLSLSPRPLL